MTHLKMWRPKDIFLHKVFQRSTQVLEYYFQRNATTRRNNIHRVAVNIAWTTHSSRSKKSANPHAALLPTEQLHFAGGAYKSAQRLAKNYDLEIFSLGIAGRTDKAALETFTSLFRKHHVIILRNHNAFQGMADCINSGKTNYFCRSSIRPIAFIALCFCKDETEVKFVFPS